MLSFNLDLMGFADYSAKAGQSCAYIFPRVIFLLFFPS